MRVGIVSLLQESNTFHPDRTTLEHFRQDLLLCGDEMRRLEGTHHEVGGFFEGLARHGLDVVPVFMARALPFGRVTAETETQLLDLMFRELERAGRLDGVLVAPHGATVGEAHADFDGHWLGRLRQHVGQRVPIIGTFDPHANLSPAMVAATDALTAYRSNPHLDQKDRGLEAADLMARTLRGEIRPTQAARFPSLTINIECQATAEPPCLPLYQLAEEVRGRQGVLSTSVVLGFPYADVAEMGSAVLAVTDNDPALAERCAAELADHLWTRRQEFVGRLLSPADAVSQAAKLAGPVCLLDMGDNVGGGSPGDSTVLACELLEQGVGPSFVCLYDPEAVRRAEGLGIGRSGAFSVGNPALEGTFTVADLRDGTFEEPLARHGGFRRFDQGRTAILTIGPLTVMATSRRMPPFSLHQLTDLGVEPSGYQVLVAKGVHAPVAAYAPVCRHRLRVNTPGITTADLATLTYHHRRRPLFPFEA